MRREYKTAEVDLPADLQAMLRSFFDKIDDDKNGEITKEEATKFWGKNFAKVNANSMFNEVDEDHNGSISWDEFLAFWKNVVGSGYPPEDIKEEVEMMLEGGSWVDFNDGRTT
jgi:Ca2+-binding EF-hand superfamily protein